MNRLWFHPAAAVVGLCIAATVVVLNFATALLGADLPWLSAINLVANLAVLGAMVMFIVQSSMQAEAIQSSTRRALDESQARLAAVMDSAMDAIITVD